MHLLLAAADDFAALMGCALAFLGATSVMYGSYYLSPASRRARTNIVEPAPLPSNRRADDRAA